MRRPIGRVAGLLGVGLLGLTCAAAAQDREGRVERAGERVDETLRDVREWFRDVSDDVRGGIARSRASVQAMGIEARVYSRLHWDKDLNDDRVVVHVDRDGLAMLRGTVSDPREKAKAAELARDTIGVTGVDDKVVVRPPVDRDGDRP